MGGENIAARKIGTVTEEQEGEVGKSDNQDVYWHKKSTTTCVGHKAQDTSLSAKGQRSKGKMHKV